MAASKTKTKSAGKKTATARRPASKKTNEEVAAAPAAKTAEASAPPAAPAPKVEDTEVDRNQHVHTERAAAMLPASLQPAAFIPVSVEDQRMQDALSKQKK